MKKGAICRRSFFTLRQKMVIKPDLDPMHEEMKKHIAKLLDLCYHRYARLCYRLEYYDRKARGEEQKNRVGKKLLDRYFREEKHLKKIYD